MTDATSNSYAAALKQAEAELASHDARGQALRTTIESLKALLSVGAAAPAPVRRAPGRKPRKKAAAKTPRLRKPRRSAGAGHPPVSSNHYSGLGPTAAYRKFIAEFGESYTVPQIRDALVAGGVRSKSATSLLTGLHSVRRRDQVKAAAEAAAAAATAAAADDAS